MSEVTIRTQADGRLLISLGREIATGGLAMAARKLGAARVRHAPADLVDEALLGQGDALCVLVAGTEAADRVLKLLKLKVPALGRGGAYRIAAARKGERTVGAVIGGDAFGAMAGLSDFIRWSEWTAEGLVYKGGERTETPAFPLRFYWTWDHSTNWVLDDPGNQVNGCNNPYLKKPETFLEDYRRLIDHAVDTRFNAVMISGFFRDSHGGEAFAHEIARYGADRGVAVLPGIGVTSYSGIYYEGNHPANLDTFLARNPKCRALTPEGQPCGNLSPYRPEGRRYIERSLEWMMRSFPVGGVYMENGDYIVDHSALARRKRKEIPTREEDFLKEQYVAYKCALDVLDRICPDAWNVYVTYCGFDRDGSRKLDRGLGAEVPYFATHMPASALCMWTLSGMLRTMPSRLRDWMDSPAPASVYDNPKWPRGLKPPTPRSAGFMHQGSQWSPIPRSGLALSAFAEGCLRSWESGLEGISIHGEASSRTMTWLLNYLGMRHWTYHPRSTLREFAAAELQPRLGGAKEASDFIEALCLLEEGKHADAREITKPYIGTGYSWRGTERTLGQLDRLRMWMELKWWACHPDSAVNMLPRISDII